MSRLLIVEDEAHLADGLRFNLEAEGHAADVVATGEAALEKLLAEHAYDAVVLDVMLPGIDGFSVAADLRRAGQYVPVLMLTARGRPEDVLKGFESGADDYLPKPFDLAILIARINGLLRRNQWTRKETPRAGGGDTPPASNSRAAGSDVVSFNGKVVDFRSLELRAGERTIHLTMMEADLLRHLIRNNGHVVSRQSLLEDVWGLREDTDTRAIDNFVVRLRRYIEREPARPRHLLTVRGVGYKFILEPAEESKKTRLSRWRA